MADDILTVGSLFSGIGGIELGLEHTGRFRTRWFVECNPYARAVLRKHWPGVTCHDDITTIDWSTVERIDVLTGGFPCQDISLAGKQKGIKEGTRSGLWFEFKKAIAAVEPRYVLIENVSALLRNGMEIVLSDLSALGFDAEWHCVPAASVGAPHRRDRVFIVAYAKSARIRSDPPTMECSTRTSQEESEVPWGRTNASICSRQDVADTDCDRRKQMPERFPDKSCSDRTTSEFQETPHISNSACFRLEEQELQPRLHTWQQEVSLSNADISGLETGFSRSDLKKSLERFCGTVGRQQWEVEPDVGRVADGVPKRVDRIRCLGNAVVPQVAQFIGQRIIEMEEGSIAA